MKVDRITLTVLDDGTAKLETDGISGANHTKADRLVNFFAKLLGGKPTVQSKRRHGKNRASTNLSESNKAST